MKQSLKKVDKMQLKNYSTVQTLGLCSAKIDVLVDKYIDFNIYYCRDIVRKYEENPEQDYALHALNQFLIRGESLGSKRITLPERKALIKIQSELGARLPEFHQKFSSDPEYIKILSNPYRWLKHLQDKGLRVPVHTHELRLAFWACEALMLFLEI